MTEEALFAEALEKETQAERAEFLDRACGQDHELRQRIEQLLEVHESPSSLLDHPASPELTRAIAECQVPQRLGDFEIVREIGHGGMGVVYEARQVSLNRRVALKVLSAELSAKALLRFQREAEAAARLHHTNIVPIHLTGREGRFHYYVMELIDGPSLDRVLLQMRSKNEGENQETPVGDVFSLRETASGKHSDTLVEPSSLLSLHCDEEYFDTVARMMAEVSDALAHAHDHGVIHRDIKPSNLLLSEDGRLSINDFGLARMLEEPGMTSTGEFMGSPLYMSPEQVAGQRGLLDHRTDIYSLGATLYEMLTFRPPFDGEHTYSVLSKILHEEPVSPRRIVRRIPVDLETICNKAMEKDRRRRYATSDKLAEDLNCFLNRRAISARRIGPVGKAVRWCRRNPQISALAATLALVAIIGVAAFTLQRHYWSEDVRHQEDLQQFLGDDLVAITALFKEGEYVEALRRVNDLPNHFANRPEVVSLLTEYTSSTFMETDPGGATIAIRQHNRPNQQPLKLGNAPLEDVHIPNVDLTFYISKDGHDDLVLLRTLVWAQCDVGFGFHLPEVGSNMVRVEGSNKRAPTNSNISIPFIGHFHSLEIPPFLIDRYEVTNEQFRAFVDAGGYKEEKYWNATLGADWQKVVNTFRDQTNHFGPKVWRDGKYPSDKAKHPVRGVSWYEAAAYAKFVSKKLPTIFHFNAAARRFPGEGQALIGYSNLDNRNDGSVEVGSLPNVGAYGAYDLAGNVREWCFTEHEQGKRYALGASWRDAADTYTIPRAFDPLDRPDDVGFRCAQYDDTAEILARTPFVDRDFLAEHEERQKLFPTLEPLRDQFIPDCSTRDFERVLTTRLGPYRCETLSLRAGYPPDSERVLAFLVFPDSNKYAPPFQTVIVTPSGPGVFDRSATPDYVVESERTRSHLAAGRAVLFPVFWGTYQRRNDELTCICTHNNPALDRGIINIANDFSRCVSLLQDYNEAFNANVIDATNLVFHGSGWGSIIAPILLASDELVTGKRRLQTAVLQDSGFWPTEPPPQVDQLTYVPHINIPVFMLNARNHARLPFKTAQEPMYQLLPLTASGGNLLIPSLGGVAHDRATNSWLDAKLGAPARK